MELITMLYIADLANSVCTFLMILSLVSFFATIIAVGAYNGEHYKPALFYAKFLPKVAVASAVIACFIPSQKTIYLMLAVKTSQDIMNNPRIQELGSKALKIIDQKLTELEEIKK